MSCGLQEQTAGIEALSLSYKFFAEYGAHLFSRNEPLADESISSFIFRHRGMEAPPRRRVVNGATLRKTTGRRPQELPSEAPVTLRFPHKTRVLNPQKKRVR